MTFGRSLGWLAVAALVASCGSGGNEVVPIPDAGSGGNVGTPDAGTPDAGTPDAGTPDAGTPDAGTPDAGTPDAGTPDAGTLDAGTPDAGTPDAGTLDAGTLDGGTDGGPTVITFPNAAGWTFYGTQDGLPSTVLGVSADQGGNLWVAGAEEGLFVLRSGGSRFERFTMADGLRPYGYMPDGSAPPGDKYLKVLSVAGGPPGVVFAGYQGKPPAPGDFDCESNWDGPHPDPSIYKSGDADRVTLAGSGINVVHYDIFSGPNVVGHELRGREKLCHILRIVYDPGQNAVWFGGNHGFAYGKANFAGNPNCNGQLNCTGVLEHVHPAINGYQSNNNNNVVYLTADYYGVGVDPQTHDVWFGGLIRTTKFKFASSGGNYFQAELFTEGSQYSNNRIDIWPDRVQEPGYPRPSDRVDDAVSGLAAMDDGTAWVGSFSWGLAHLAGNGAVVGYLKDSLLSRHVTAVAADSADQSVWAGVASGHGYSGGISRIQGNTIQQYGQNVFGPDLAQSTISDVQMQGRGSSRRVLVGFRTGAIGIYSGP